MGSRSVYIIALDVEACQKRGKEVVSEDGGARLFCDDVFCSTSRALVYMARLADDNHGELVIIPATDRGMPQATVVVPPVEGDGGEWQEMYHLRKAFLRGFNAI